jgi:hypothetical protein
MSDIGSEIRRRLLALPGGREQNLEGASDEEIKEFGQKGTPDVIPAFGAAERRVVRGPNGLSVCRAASSLEVFPLAGK